MSPPSRLQLRSVHRNSKYRIVKLAYTLRTDGDPHIFEELFEESLIRLKTDAPTPAHIHKVGTRLDFALAESFPLHVEFRNLTTIHSDLIMARIASLAQSGKKLLLGSEITCTYTVMYSM